MRLLLVAGLCLVMELVLGSREHGEIIIPASSGIGYGIGGYGNPALFGTRLLGFGDYVGGLGSGGYRGLGSAALIGGGLGGYHTGYDSTSGGYGGKGYNGVGGAAEDSSYLAGGGQKGEKGVVASQSFKGNEGAAKENTQNQGYYGEKDGALNSYDKGSGVYGATSSQQSGGSQGALNNQASHKKGHSKKGFQNFHHKDESGQSSTYFDESNDEGDHFEKKGVQGEFGNQGGLSYKGQAEDGSFQQANNGQQGHFDKGHLVDDRQGEVGQQGDKRYYGDSVNYGQNKAFNDFGKKGNFNQQQFGGEHSQANGDGYKKGYGLGGYGGYGGYGGLAGYGGLGGFY